MLLELHVRNLALIEKADLEFKQGLTVLSGETGAGKSILIDSICLALGAKAGKDTIRTGAEYAYIEALFSVTEDKRKLLEEYDVTPDESNTIIISRKILPTRSVSKINDETVTIARLRSITSLLIDIHGQNEHQSLLRESKQLEFLDMASPKETIQIKQELAKAYRDYTGIMDALSENMDASIRQREKEILRYEIDEIENAHLKVGEEEELLDQFRKFKHASKITEALNKAYEVLDEDSIERAVKSLADVVDYAQDISLLYNQLTELDTLKSDALRQITEYQSSMNYDEDSFEKIENRLDTIHRIQGKYTDDIEDILNECEKKKTRLEMLENYDVNHDKLLEEKERIIKKLNELCNRLTKLRNQGKLILEERITKELSDLNFLDAQFEIELSDKDDYSVTGKNKAVFLISTNPGEPVKPLSMVASGGELSRIMLALKTVLADADEIETLIFDEIDSGISGRTAQKVSEKLSYIGRHHQVLCITHLAQIAAMADHNYLISKNTYEGRTKTDVLEISEEEVITELSRMIGGSKITPAVIDTAKEMRELAKASK